MKEMRMQQMFATEHGGSVIMAFIGNTSDVVPGLAGLSPDFADTVERRLFCSEDKPALIDEVSALIGESDEKHILLGQKAALMLDEMLENALYAAPRSADGAMLFPKRSPRTLLAEEQILVRYRYDGTRFSLEVKDSWGSLTQGQLFSYLALNSQENTPDPDRTGRGLFFMWRVFDYFSVRIHPGQETVIGGSLLLQTDNN
jgi:hypothetical protein